MERHVLVVFPHPDDESFGAAGTIALHAQNGTPITYACATLGEMGRNMGKPIFANRETLPQLRKAELLHACEILGINDLRLLGFRDKTLEFEEDLLINKIKTIIEEVKPSLLITHYPGHGVHPDHDACSLATIKAVGQIDKELRPKIICIAITKNRVEALGEPDVIIDIRSVSDIKINAIKAHRSQTEGMIQDIEYQLLKENHEIRKWLEEETYWTYSFDA